MMSTEATTTTTPPLGGTSTTSPRGGGSRSAMGRAVGTGALLGFLAVGSVVTTVALLAGVDPLGALGVGLFAALWDGLGMGAMFGAVHCAQRRSTDSSRGEGPVEPTDGRRQRRDHAGSD